VGGGSFDCGHYAEEVGGKRSAVGVVVRHGGYDLGDNGVEGECEAGLKCGVCGCYVMLSPHNNRPIRIKRIKTAFGVTFLRLFGRWLATTHCHLLST